MKKIELVCSNEECGRSFLKPKNEYDRRVRLGKSKFYCCLSCAGKSKENLDHINRVRHKDFKTFLRKGSCVDQFSPYRRFIKTAKKSHCVKKRGQSMNLTLEYLRFLWEEQRGFCRLSGLPMETYSSTSRRENIPSYRLASLDRIDSKLGYVEGNVQFVLVPLNLGKSNFTQESFIDFCISSSTNHRRQSDEVDIRQFNYYRNKAKQRKGDLLEREIIKKVWQTQGGLCAITNIPMYLPESLKTWSYSTDEPRKASLDRIDPDEGYTEGNIQFVCLSANYVKGQASNEIARRLIEAVAEKHR